VTREIRRSPITTTTDSHLAFAGPIALAGMVRDGQVHPRELVELYLRRIDALDPKLNAFRVLRAEQALAEAETVDRSGPLAGVPIAVKDEMEVAGEVATRGTRSFGPPAAADHEAVRRLRAAGAIPLGVTNAPELMIFPWTVSLANGVTRNPWDPSRTPGGSSGGSAAAVASGLVAAATAGDGGGSIRIPAASCGLVGFKPSRSRAAAELTSGWLGLTVFGALARSVVDSALMLGVMYAGPGDDPRQARRFLDAAAREPGRLRIAISRRLPPGQLGKVADDQRQAWERTAQTLRGLGHDVVERDPAYGLVQLEFLQYWLRGVYEESLSVPDRSTLERSSRQMAVGGRFLVPASRRRRLLSRRSATIARIAKLWDEVDVLMTPGLATTAIGAEGGFGRAAPAAIDMAGRFTPFTAPFNVTGQPAVALPAGLGSDGLPLSVQLVGRLGAEELLYSLAAQIEAADPWAPRRPPVS
jgi:amidase